MNANDILTLAKAGFNATQIAALMQISNAPVPAPAPTPVPAPVPAPVPTPIPAPVSTPVSTPNTDPILAQIEKLQTMMQANAIINSSLPPQQQTTEDILANIINPPKPTENK